jgi:hypothetical protein
MADQDQLSQVLDGPVGKDICITYNEARNVAVWTPIKAKKVEV